MSLFTDDNYRWRDRYCVFLEAGRRPAAETVRRELAALDARYEIKSILADDQGRLRSLSLLAPLDFAAMDITYVYGEDVIAQALELAETLSPVCRTPNNHQQLLQLAHCDARLDIDHFEQLVLEEALPADELDWLEENDQDALADEHLDPGTLLRVIRRLSNLCQDVGVDPQSGEFV